MRYVALPRYFSLKYHFLFLFVKIRFIFIQSAFEENLEALLTGRSGQTPHPSVATILLGQSPLSRVSVEIFWFWRGQNMHFGVH